MAYILEETKGNLPTWLAPVQARIMPVKTDDPELNAYAQEDCTMHWMQQMSVLS